MKKVIKKARMQEIVSKIMHSVLHDIEVSTDCLPKEDLMHECLGAMLAATGAMMLVYAETCGKPIKEVVQNWTATLAESAVATEDALKDPNVIYLWDRKR
jgi:hypothetical protein